MSENIMQYKMQLTAVERSLLFASDSERPDLLDLQEKLKEVIALLEENQNALESDSKNGSSSKGNSSDSIDDEFLKFQKEINDLENADNDSDSSEEIEEVHSELYKVLSSMEGKKCRAPFIRQWGEKAYHNAIIFSTDLEEQDIDDLNNVQVKVMFCNPLCEEMKPCPYFLDGHCKFDADKCRFSHGYSVQYSDLEDYVLPDYSNIRRDSKCLAKYKDGLWYIAIIENCLDDNKFVVKYDSCGSTDTLAAYDVLPFENLCISDDDTSSESSYDGSALETQQSSHSSALETQQSSHSSALETQQSSHSSEKNTQQSEINYVADVGSSPIGTWERHTKGIGSKIMAKMGYVWGQGLGKNSDGRLEPVEAIFFPRGKSLDQCAQAREFSGPVSVEDIFNSEKAKEEERIKKLESGSKLDYPIFDFLNEKIYKLPACAEEDVPLLFQVRKRASSEKTAGPEKKSQNRDLNFEMYSVGEDIKNAKKEIMRIQQSLSRNSKRNEVACTRLKQQMTAQNTLLRKLEAKEQKISDQLNVRKNHKKIVTF